MVAEEQGLADSSDCLPSCDSSGSSDFPATAGTVVAVVAAVADADAVSRHRSCPDSASSRLLVACFVAAAAVVVVAAD